LPSFHSDYYTLVYGCELSIYISTMAEENPRKSIVEDVFIPKELLTTAKFNSPWELARWEQSLPDNDRIISLPEPRTSSNRPLSLSALRSVARPKSAIRSRGRSDPPAFQGMELISISMAKLYQIDAKVLYTSANPIPFFRYIRLL
jgi:hypothetical protein